MHIMRGATAVDTKWTEYYDRARPTCAQGLRWWASTLGDFQCYAAPAPCGGQEGGIEGQTDMLRVETNNDPTAAR